MKGLSLRAKPVNRSLTTVFALALAALSGCVLFADPSYENPCGGTELLLHEGHAAIPNARCGVCEDGFLACEGPNRIACLGATFTCTQQPDEPRCGDAIPNLCGGCQDLPGEPGSADGCSGASEVWICTGTDDTACFPNPGNICGGVTTLIYEALPATPALPCGPCDHGVLICDIGGNLDVLQCFDRDEDQGANACDGCNVLLHPVPESEGDVVEACGCGSEGVWACADVPGDAVVCEGARPHNGCGGCERLSQTPGSPCGDRMIVACNGPNDVDCVDQDTHNSCGGRGVLSLRPGQRCGVDSLSTGEEEVCEDGTAVCTTSETIACLEASSPNACGVCGFGLPFEPNTNCGPDHLWVCGPDGQLVCAEQIDPDEDGSFSEVDNCPDDANADQADFDGDGVGDACDDTDGDGVLDDIDPCPEVPHDPLIDTNDNDIPDGCEDTDGDTISNAIDNCPEGINPLQEDFDEDGIGDACDPDYDGDGVDDGPDNCPDHPNPGQEDQDDDGIGDACAGDQDEDGFMAIVDCDDSDPAINPDASEVCDGVDNDCSGQVDDGALDAVEWFRDFDRDGAAGDLEGVMACEAPDAWYQREATDCDDLDRHIFPTADELCDGVDEDCDETIDEDATNTVPYWNDDDDDGYGAEGEPAGFVCLRDVPDGAATNAFDCNDESRDINPDAREICGGGDENCNGRVDDEDRELDAEGTGILWYFDGDGDGFGDMEFMWACEALFPRLVEDGGDCIDADPESFPGAVELCDGLDNSCSGIADDVLEEDLPLWFADSDGDGFGDPDPDTTTRSCEVPAGFVDNFDDCNDGDGAINPDATEDAGNLVDEDCLDGAAPFTDLVPTDDDRTLNEFESPYRVIGDYIVEEDTTLIVPACIEFLFEADASLTVNGELRIVGTTECPVVMRSAEDPPLPGSWSGIHFEGLAVGASFGLSTEWIGGSLLKNLTILHAGSRDSVISSRSGIPAVDGVAISASNGAGIDYALPEDDFSLISVLNFRAEGLDEGLRIDALSATVIVDEAQIDDSARIGSLSARTLSITSSRFYDNEESLEVRTTGDFDYESNQLWAGPSDGLVVGEATGVTSMTDNLFVGGDHAVTFSGATTRVLFLKNIIAAANTSILTGDLLGALDAQSSQFLRSETALRIENTADAVSHITGSDNLIQGSTGSEAIYFGPGSSRFVSSTWGSSAFYEIDGNFVYSGHELGDTISMVRNWWSGLMGDELELRIYDSTNERSLATVAVGGAWENYPATCPAPAPIVTSVTLLDDGVLAGWEASIDGSVRGYRIWLSPNPRWHRSLAELIDGSGVYTTETTATFDLEDASGPFWFYVSAVRDESDPDLDAQLSGDHSWFSEPVLATSR